MGVLEFFGTLVNSKITSESIDINTRNNIDCDHFFIDFNSIVHVSSKFVLDEINAFLKLLLQLLFANSNFNNFKAQQYFDKYNCNDLKENLIKNDKLDQNKLIKLFYEKFNNELIDKIVLNLVIKTLLSIVKTYCNTNVLKTLMIAIDGVPSKGKLIEQK